MSDLLNSSDDGSKSEFVSKFLAHERAIRRFARMLVFNENDADDVFQAATVTMFEKFGTLDAQADFPRWAREIVVFKVMELIQKRKRDRLRFQSEATLQLLADDAAEMFESLGARSLALETCLRKLSAPTRKLLADRYERGESVEVIAATMRRTIRAVYQALHRSRKSLHNCITATIENRGVVS